MVIMPFGLEDRYLRCFSAGLSTRQAFLAPPVFLSSTEVNCNLSSTHFYNIITLFFFFFASLNKSLFYEHGAFVMSVNQQKLLSGQT